MTDPVTGNPITTREMILVSYVMFAYGTLFGVLLPLLLGLPAAIATGIICSIIQTVRLWRYLRA